MTESDAHLNAGACAIFNQTTSQMSASSPSPGPPLQPTAMNNSDANELLKSRAPDEQDEQLDVELTELFDDPAPNETVASPPRAPHAEPITANESDPQLDAELSKVIDKPAAKEVPPSPPRAVPQQKRSLLHALRANTQRLSLSAACKKPGAGDRQPVSSVISVKNALSKQPTAEQPEAAHVGDDTTKEKQEEAETSVGGRACDKASSAAPLSTRELMVRRQVAKNAASQPRRARSNPAMQMQIINASTSASPSTGKQQKQFSFHDRDTTNVSLKDAPYDGATLRALFEHHTRVDIGELAIKSDQLRAGSIRDAVVFGVVVEKHSKKRAKDGSSYAVWTLYNMPRFERSGCAPTSVLLLLFGAAFERWHNVVPGAVFALRKATLLPPRQAEKQSVRGVCLKVSQERHLLYLGVCGDYAVCEALRFDGGPCGKWYDANRLNMCAFHRSQKLKRLTSSQRMDVNNAVRPSMKRPDLKDERKLSSVIPAESEKQRRRPSVRKENKQQKEDNKRIRRLRDSRQHAKAASANGGQQAQVTGVRRKQYKNAVYTLQQLGFTLDEHGSLQAPRDAARTSDYGPLFKRARTQGAATAALTARATEALTARATEAATARATEAATARADDKRSDASRAAADGQDAPAAAPMQLELSDESDSDTAD